VWLLSLIPLLSALTLRAPARSHVLALLVILAALILGAGLALRLWRGQVLGALVWDGAQWLLVYCATHSCTYKTDGFVRQARRKAQRYPLVSRAFATRHGGQRRGFMYSYGWRSALEQAGKDRATLTITPPGIRFDSQRWLLLSARNGRRPIWLWVGRSADPHGWHALRCALYAQVPIPQPA
jgi:hypothetical protein